MNKSLHITTSWEIISNNKLDEILFSKKLDKNNFRESSPPKINHRPVKLRAFLHPELPKLYPCDIKLTLVNDTQDVFASVLVVSSQENVEFINGSDYTSKASFGSRKNISTPHMGMTEKTKSFRQYRNSRPITYSTKEENNFHTYFIPLEETKEIIIRFVLEDNIDLFLNLINVQIRNKSCNETKFKQNLMLPSHDITLRQNQISTIDTNHMDVIKDLTHHMLCALESDKHNLNSKVTAEVRESMKILLKNVREKQYFSDSEEDDKKTKSPEEDYSRRIDQRLKILEAKIDYLISMVGMKM